LLCQRRENRFPSRARVYGYYVTLLERGSVDTMTRSRVQTDGPVAFEGNHPSRKIKYPSQSLYLCTAAPVERRLVPDCRADL